MELVKNIFFNTDKLTPNTKVKISYTGKFYQDSSDEVYMHYGFGNSWENLNDVKMEKTELGFQTELELIDSDTLNFCFKNEFNIWDNNDNKNYIFPVEHIETSLVTTNTDSIIISSPRRLRKSYLLTKKIKLAIYKIITYVPKIISGNYKKKGTNLQNI